MRDAAPQITPAPERLDLARDLFAQGEADLQSGELVSSEALFSRVVKEYPSSRLVPAAWFRLAKLHTITGRRDLALGEYRLVAEIYPQAEFYDKARKILADLNEGAGHPLKALENLDAMVLADGFFDKADIEAQKTRLKSEKETSDAS